MKAHLDDAGNPYFDGELLEEFGIALKKNLHLRIRITPLLHLTSLRNHQKSRCQQSQISSLKNSTDPTEILLLR